MCIRDSFSMLTPGSITTFSIVAATGTAQAASFPNATIATYNSSNPGYYNYYSTTSSAFSIEGYAYGAPSNTILPYSNPQAVLNYPFTMGSSFVDSYYG